MITFYSRQQYHAWHRSKNGNAGTVNFNSQFTPQIESSICTIVFTKCVKPDATIFTSRCSRMSACYRFRGGQALPLIFIRLSRLANSSPTNRRNPAIRSRNGREPSGKKSGEMSRLLPHNFPAIAGRWKSQRCEFPREQLARRLASGRATVAQRPRRSPSKRQCNIPRNIPQADSSKFCHHVFNHDSQQL